MAVLAVFFTPPFLESRFRFISPLFVVFSLPPLFLFQEKIYQVTYFPCLDVFLMIIFSASVVCGLLMDQLSETWIFALALISFVVLLLGGSLNAIFLLGYLKGYIAKSQTITIYVALAGVDLLTCVIVSPFYFTPFFSKPITKNCLYDSTRVQLSAGLVSASAYIVTLLSFDRYLLIKYPLHPFLAPTHLSLIFITITALAAGIPFLRLIPGEIATKLYYGIVLLNGFLIILTLIMSYANLIRVLRRTYRSISNQNSHLLRREARVTKIAAIVISLFIAMHLPMFCYHFFTYIQPHDTYNAGALFAIAIAMALLNSVVNPTLYYFLNGTIRTQLAKMLLCIGPNVQPVVRYEQGLPTRSALNDHTPFTTHDQTAIVSTPTLKTFYEPESQNTTLPARNLTPPGFQTRPITVLYDHKGCHMSLGLDDWHDSFGITNNTPANSLSMQASITEPPVDSPFRDL